MESISKSIIIGCGAFLGANARYWLGGWIQSKLGSTFPWQTMIINISGSLVIGLFLEMALQENWDPRWRLFLAIGILGGYTTYSTFGWEASNLFTDRSIDAAFFYMFGTALLCVAAAWIGRIAARALVGG